MRTSVDTDWREAIDEARSRRDRVPTGVPGLDALVGGGFPLHRTVLLQGDIGTGKTTFGLQFLLRGAACGAAGVLVCVDQKPQHVIEDARRGAWGLDDAIDRQLVTLLGASPAFTAMRGRNGLDARQVASDLTQQIRRVTASRLVIDAVDSLIPEGAARGDVEDFVRSLLLALEDNLGCTTLLTMRTGDGLDGAVTGRTAERLASGVIELRRDPVGGYRSLLIRKMRGAPMSLDEQALDIVDGRGLVVRGGGSRS